MKDYNKLIKKINKNPDYKFVKSGRKSTIKLVHVATDSMYSIHPGNNAIRPLEQWMKKIEKQ